MVVQLRYDSGTKKSAELRVGCGCSRNQGRGRWDDRERKMGNKGWRMTDKSGPSRKKKGNETAPCGSLQAKTATRTINGI